MSDVTRRGFVKHSAGAAVGASALAALLADRVAADEGGGARRPIVAYVSDPSSGEISVMSAEGETTVRDRRLAARIAAAARTGV